MLPDPCLPDPSLHDPCEKRVHAPASSATAAPCDNAPARVRAVQVLELIAWLASDEARDLDEIDLIPRLGEKLGRLPLAVDCIAIYLRDLHPEIRARIVLWSVGVAPVLLDRTHRMRHIIDFPGSPIRLAMETQSWQAASVALAAVAPGGEMSEGLAMFRARGICSLLTAPLTAHKGLASAIVFATRRVEGFSTGERQVLEQILPALCTAFELRQLRRVETSLLETYVGPLTGQRILAGRIRQGDVESLEAALLLCDLRDFTRISNRLAPAEVLAFLNNYFDQVVPEIVRNGGEVVKFIGDAILAFFHSDAGPRAACDAAFRAACGIQDRLGAQSAAMPPLRAGTGLHHGQISYGNIGSGRRLDFTVIGRDVNLLSRIQGITGSHGYPVLMSGAFAGFLGSDACRAAGCFSLKGFSDPVELFAPAGVTP